MKINIVTTDTLEFKEEEKETIKKAIEILKKILDNNIKSISCIGWKRFSKEDIEETIAIGEKLLNLNNFNIMDIYNFNSEE